MGRVVGPCPCAPMPGGPCGVSVLEHSSAAGCLEQGPASGTWGSGMEAELMGLSIPTHDVGLEDGGCPWAGGGLEEGVLSHRASLQPGLGGLSPGPYWKPLKPAESFTCVCIYYSHLPLSFSVFISVSSPPPSCPPPFIFISS